MAATTTTRKKLKTCFCYYRVSSLQQKERGTIRRQNQLIPGLVKKLSLRNLADYRDDGVSGRHTATREAFTEMIADLPKLKPDSIVFLRADRLGRPEDWQTLMELINAAPQYQVNLVYLKEDTVTGELETKIVHYDDPVALYTLQGELLRAGEENKRKGRDIRQGFFGALVSGKWLFGQQPFGWKWNRQKNHFDVVPEQAKTIRLMFDRLCAGVGSPKIAQELREQKTLLPKAQSSPKARQTLAARGPNAEYRWNQATVRRIVAREYLYTGTMQIDMAERYGDLFQTYLQGRNGDGSDALISNRYIEFGMHDAKGKPLISQHPFQKAHAFIARNRARHGGQSRKGQQQHFLFGPWLRCDCGGSIKARTHHFTNPIKGETVYRYYSCRCNSADTSREGGKRCLAPHLKADEIDARLWEMLKMWLSRPSTILNQWLDGQAAKGIDVAKLRTELAAAEKQLAKHERNRSKWLDLFGEDAISKSELKKRSRGDAESIEELTDQIETLTSTIAIHAEREGKNTRAQKLLPQFEKKMKAGAAGLQEQLARMKWQQRRTLLNRVFGTNEIVFGYVPMYEVRGPIKYRYEDAAEGQRVADEFVEAFCVKRPAEDEIEGLFIRGVFLPVDPAEILDALSAVGVRPVFASKNSPLA